GICGVGIKDFHLLRDVVELFKRNRLEDFVLKLLRNFSCLPESDSKHKTDLLVDNTMLKQAHMILPDFLHQCLEIRPITRRIPLGQNSCIEESVKRGIIKIAASSLVIWTPHA